MHIHVLYTVDVAEVACLDYVQLVHTDNVGPMYKVRDTSSLYRSEKITMSALKDCILCFTTTIDIWIYVQYLYRKEALRWEATKHHHDPCMDFL